MKTLAVLLALVAAGCSRPPDPSADGPDTVVPATSAATSPTPAASPQPPRLSDLPTGPAPRVGYVVATTYVAPDGARTELPHRRSFRLGGVVASAGGLLVDDGVYFEGTSGLSLVTDAGVERLRPCTSGAAGDGVALGWATFACPETGQVAPTVLHLRTPDGERTQRLRDLPDHHGLLTSVVGVLDDEVIFTRAVGRGGTFRSDLVHPPRRIPGITGVAAVDERGGLLAAFRGVDGRRVAVVDTRAGEVLWRDRRWRPADFSPDGARVVGHDHHGAWTVRDARSGEPDVRLALPSGVRLEEVVWEDDRHLVALARAQGDSTLLRVGPDGVPERITPLACAACAAGYLLAR